MVQEQLTPGAKENPKGSIIKSFSYSEKTILKGIMRLYCPGGFYLDPTYSKGQIYKGLPGPEFKYDLNPKTKDTRKADCRDLPIPNNKAPNIVFDPPFITGSHVAGKQGKMKGRFSYFKNPKELLDMYQKSMEEFYGILEPGGFLIFKCQDTIDSRKQYIIHNEIINRAQEIGYYTRDLFILLAKSRLIHPRHRNQQHTRKFHCYYLVFQKLGARAPWSGGNG